MPAIIKEANQLLIPYSFLRNSWVVSKPFLKYFSISGGPLYFLCYERRLDWFSWKLDIVR